MGASVVACYDAPPVLELGEHVLDFVALLVEALVIIAGLFSVLPAWDAGRDVPGCQLIAEPVAVIAPVADESRTLSRAHRG